MSDEEDHDRRKRQKTFEDAVEGPKTPHEAVVLGMSWDYKKGRAKPGREWRKTPGELQEGLKAHFSAEESEKAWQYCGFGAARRSNDPKALVLIGPAGAGKSSLCCEFEEALQISLGDFAELDGDKMRECHGGWCRAVHDPKVGYNDAHEFMKPVVRKLKDTFMDKLLDERADIATPMTFSTPGNAKDFLRFESAGYKILVIGVVVSFEEARDRTLCRGHVDGRFQEPTYSKWEACMTGLKEHLPRAEAAAVFYHETVGSVRLLHRRGPGLQSLGSLQVVEDEIQRLASKSKAASG